MTLESFSHTARTWIRYEDGTYEPVRLDGNLMNKRRGPGIPDWWAVDMPRNWSPESAGYPATDNHPSGPLTARRDSARQSDMLINKDVEGRIIKRMLQVKGLPRDYDYQYDEDGRLAEACLNGVLREWYRYDSKGRRRMDMVSRLGNRKRCFVYDQGNRLVRAGDATYEHDSFGFRSAVCHEGGRTEYAYAPDFRLLSVVLPDGTRIEYDHDEDDMPCAKRVDGRLREGYQWLDLERLDAFHDGTAAYTFLYQDDERLPYGMMSGRDILFLNYDQAGSLVSVADSNGAMIKYIEYDTFGNILHETNPALHVPLGFGGGLHDRHSGLVRFGWRDYDPDTGRWTARDPQSPASGTPESYDLTLTNPTAFEAGKTNAA